VKEYVYSCRGSVEGSEALRHFGTNALPEIRRALRVRDTATRRALVWLAGHQRIVKVNVKSAENIHFSGLLAYEDILELVHERHLSPVVADSCALRSGLWPRRVELTRVMRALTC
jgi:hypothetical protein